MKIHDHRLGIVQFCLRTGLFLLFLPEGPKGNTGDLDSLEFAPGDITNGVTFTTKTSNEDFVVSFNEV
jgi:hypothetical protein